MKRNLITIILVALVLLQIIDGDFAAPGVLDYIKFVLLALALVLNIIVSRRK
ncbi:hypothetical protein [Lutispora thermophila]|uniref:hypothetical protein n=1 Tax=Lutispora thermophila TaxID=288966 RepID=UPI001587567B|nr:hypothetical protein [Lutispora thermophila]